MPTNVDVDKVRSLKSSGANGGSWIMVPFDI